MSASLVGIIKKGVYDAENVLKLCFIVSALVRMSFTSTLGYVVCFMALLRQYKRPRWTKEYGQKFFLSEFTHNIMYLFVFFFFSQYLHFLYYFPIVIHFWIGLSEYLYLRRGFVYLSKHNSLWKELQKYVDATRQ